MASSIRLAKSKFFLEIKLVTFPINTRGAIKDRVEVACEGVQESSTGMDAWETKLAVMSTFVRLSFRSETET